MTPRLLPLVAVAIGGVLALKALSGVQALPDLLSAAAARAEEAPEARGKAHAVSPLPVASTSPAAKPTPACAESPTDLAKEAGVSPGELQALQNLKDRRGQLDDREKALDTQLQLLAAAEAKVDAKLKAVGDVKAQIQALIGQADGQQQADVDRLIQVYQKMKPRDAAAVMATLDDKVRIPVAAKMKDSALAAILAQMPIVEAKKLTESLAERSDNAKQALRTAEQPPAVAAPPQSADPLATPAASPKPKKSRPRRLAAAERPLTPSAKAVATLAALPAQKTPQAAAPAATAVAKPPLPPTLATAPPAKS